MLASPPAVDIEPLLWPELSRLGLHTFIRRDDCLNYSGNKYYKLYLNVAEAVAQGKTLLISCGGAYSNHLHSLAKAGHDSKLDTLGIVRGFSPKNLSPTLQDAARWGMKLVFAKPSIYDKNPQSLLSEDQRKQGYFIPEGGANIHAVEGAGLIGEANRRYFDGQPFTSCIASATGTTLAGIIAASDSHTTNIGFSVLKGPDSITPSIKRALKALNNTNWRWRVIFGYHCGGYAKLNHDLASFIQRFEYNSGVKIEPVYTAKMLFAVEKLAQRGYWPKNTHLLAIHTGGLQGLRGFPDLQGI